MYNKIADADSMYNKIAEADSYHNLIKSLARSNTRTRTLIWQTNA